MTTLERFRAVGQAWFAIGAHMAIAGVAALIAAFGFVNIVGD
jgi:hypothetical protein